MDIRVTKDKKKLMYIAVGMTVLLLLLLVMLFMKIGNTLRAPTVDNKELLSDLADLADEELQEKLYENAIATQFMENYTGNEGYKIYKYKSDKVVSDKEFSNSVTSLLYNESEAIRNLNFEVLAKWAKDSKFDVSEIEAVGSEHAEDAYGIAHYTYYGPTAVARVFFVIDLKSKLPKGYLEVIDDEE